MEGCIDFSVKSNCWNIYEALYICIGCGCCSPDKQKRRENRLRVLRRLLQEQHDFDRWADGYPDMIELQKRNIKENIKYFKRRIRYYEKLEV